MTPQQEIELEEVLLGYLRSSKKIKLANILESTESDSKKVTITFEVDNDFGSTLTKPLDNPFYRLIDQNNEHETTEK